MALLFCDISFYAGDYEVVVLKLPHLKGSPRKLGSCFQISVVFFYVTFVNHWAADSTLQVIDTTSN